jgi:hypothetical protein
MEDGCDEKALCWWRGGKTSTLRSSSLACCVLQVLTYGNIYNSSICVHLITVCIIKPFFLHMYAPRCAE